MTAAEARANFISGLSAASLTACTASSKLRQRIWDEWVPAQGLDPSLEFDADALVKELEAARRAYWSGGANLTREQLVERFNEHLVAQLEHFPARVFDGVWTDGRIFHTAELPVVLQGGRRFTLSHTYSADRAAYEAADDLSELNWRDDAYGFTC